jgi:hypothetical protein
MIGYFTFYSCATATYVPNVVGGINQEDCRVNGPAVFLDVWADIIGYLLQIVLIWIAWICLPCSKAKGKPKFRYQKQLKEERKSDCGCFYCYERGGRLKLFMIYDFITFVLCIGLFLYLALSNGGNKEIWQYKVVIIHDLYILKSAMYLVKTIYGILSFPFLIFVIPTIQYLLTNSRDTGYDKYGQCVPQVPDLQ